MQPARILIHDYPGHAFPAQLARKLARRSYDVLHLSSRSVLTPRGAVGNPDSDPPSLRFSEIDLGQVIKKQAFVRRYFKEKRYGRLLAERILEFRPEIVISATTPLDAQAAALDAARKVGATFIFWLQDIQGIAIERLLGARLGVFGRLVGRHYTAMEQRLLRSSDAVVVISEDFRGVLREWNVEDRAIRTIPNWASTDEVPERPKNNPWSLAHGIATTFCFVCSGTLGMKHDPGLLLQLARHYRDDKEACVVVISEGAAAEWLATKARELELDNLLVLPFEPYATLPDVLASADVLVAILEPEAGVFSVPSKVLSYLCAARPILLAVPQENLAARTVVEAGAGVVVRPGDMQALLQEADTLRRDPERRKQMGARAREYAMKNFDLDRIADQFEEVFQFALQSRR
ncbi:MAG: glycosyltransferase family 4 protein [Gemmatimonadaceae bacterium]